MMRCKICGSRIRPGENYCPECGKKQMFHMTSIAVFLPLIIIVIILIVLSVSDIGLNIETETINSVNLSNITSLIENGGIVLQTITLKNNLFISKKFEVPKLAVCLHKKEEKDMSPLSWRYAEVDIEKYNVPKPTLDYLLYPAASPEKRQTVEILANSQKIIKVTVEKMPPHFYEDYDKIIIAEIADEERSTCKELNSEDVKNAKKILLMQD